MQTYYILIASILACHFSCYKCYNAEPSSCLSCLAIEKRELNFLSYCACVDGYYEN